MTVVYTRPREYVGFNRSGIELMKKPIIDNNLKLANT